MRKKKNLFQLEKLHKGAVIVEIYVKQLEVLKHTIVLKCESIYDRDINSAKNILMKGLLLEK